MDPGTRDKSGMYDEVMGKARAEDDEMHAAAFQADAFVSVMPMHPTLKNLRPMSPSASLTPAPSTTVPAASSDTTATCMQIAQTQSLSCPSVRAPRVDYILT